MTNKNYENWKNSEFFETMTYQEYTAMILEGRRLKQPDVVAMLKRLRNR